MTKREIKAGVFGLLTAGLLLAGCANSGQTTGTTQSPQSEDADITADEIDATAITHVEQLLEGRVAGVQVEPHPAGGFSVIIRGRNSIYGSDQPLYVIDGVPTMYGAVGVNPYDIKSIRVLKNASETAFYGVRGANGVVVITTKRGGD